MVRKLFILAISTFASLFSCAQGKPTSVTNQLKKMEWLLGTWARTNSKPGKTSFETWSKKNDNEWTGVGVTLQGRDTSFVEKLRIVIEKGHLYYVADVPENKKLVYFEMTAVTADGFVCENPTHDFPKKISYKMDGNVLRARISDSSKGIDYVFERK